MKTRTLALTVALCLVLCIGVAYALKTVRVEGDVSGPTWYAMSLENPYAVKLTPVDLEPVVNGSDNLRIGLLTSGKTVGGQDEIVLLRFKQNNVLVVASPRYNVAESELGKWTNNEAIVVLIYHNEIIVSYSNGTEIFSLDAGEEVPAMAWVYAESSTEGTPAFKASGYINVKEYPDAVNVHALTGLTNELMPLFILLIALSVVAGVCKALTKSL